MMSWDCTKNMVKIPTSLVVQRWRAAGDMVNNFLPFTSIPRSGCSSRPKRAVIQQRTSMERYIWPSQGPCYIYQKSFLRRWQTLQTKLIRLWASETQSNIARCENIYLAPFPTDHSKSKSNRKGWWVHRSDLQVGFNARRNRHDPMV